MVAGSELIELGFAGLNWPSSPTGSHQLIHKSIWTPSDPPSFGYVTPSDSPPAPVSRGRLRLRSPSHAAPGAYIQLDTYPRVHHVPGLPEQFSVLSLCGITWLFSFHSVVAGRVTKDPTLPLPPPPASIGPCRVVGASRETAGPTCRIAIPLN